MSNYMETLNIKDNFCYTDSKCNNKEFFMHGNQMQTDLAYIAGIMDADGCFMITKHARKWKGNPISPCYLPCVKISQVEEEAIKYITNVIGFGSYKLDRARIRQYKNGTRFGSKPIYDWYIRNRKVLIPFLEGIIPYLKIKKDRAKFLLNYCKTINTKINGSPGLSDKELNYREDSYIKIRELNGNKVAATTKSHRSERISDSLNKQEIA